MLSSEMFTIIGPALVAGFLIALVHAPLGVEVLRRGIIFIDLAVAQIAGLGLVAAGTLMHEPSPWLIQAVALLCAVLAGLFFRKIELTVPQQQEAIIGVSFVLAASLAILLLADHPHGGEEIQHLLSGQMLFITWDDVWLHLPVYMLILFVWFLMPKLQKGLLFYVLFALAITSSIQLVGVYVVFASLILPALAALNARRGLLVAWVSSVISVVLGIIFATFWDLPAGPLVVVAYIAVAVIFWGLLSKSARN